MPDTLIRRNFVRGNNGDYYCGHCIAENGNSGRFATQSAVMCHVENSCFWSFIDSTR